MQTTQPQEIGGLPVRGAVRALAGLVQLACLVLLFAPGLLPAAVAHAGVELEMPAWQVRALAAIGLLLAGVARAALGRGRRTNLESALEELARQTGGTYAKERARVVSGSTVGGPTVRWTVHGVPIALSCARTGRGKAATRCTADVRPARPFQFVAMPQNAFTKVLSSPAVWGFILSTARRQGGTGGASAEERQKAIGRMEFLAAPEVPLDHPDLQRGVLLKSDDPSQARSFFGRLREPLLRFRGSCRLWQMSLLHADRAGNHRLLVEGPGVETRPETLRAGYDLMHAALAALREGGALRPGSEDSAAA